MNEPNALIAGEYCRRTSQNPKYSLRAFARDIDVPVSALSEIISKNRKVTPQMGAKIAKGLNLGPRKQKVFLDAIFSQKYGSFFEKSKTRDSRHYDLLEEDKFQVISDWYHFAILSLMNTKNFRFNEHWIASRLGLNPIEVKTAISRLLRVGLLEINNKKLIRTRKNIRTTTDIFNKALQKAHKQDLKKASEALDGVSVELRDFKSLTIPFDPSRIKSAKKCLNEFLTKMDCLFEDRNGKEVYNLNIQFYPVTKQKEQR